MRRWASRIFALFTTTDKALTAQLEHLLGYRPQHLPYYQLAFTHRSNGEEAINNNERLEYLGDAILGAVIAEYLFKKYPYEQEGFMTEMRSRMVRRESLNAVALRMGINKLIAYNQADRGLARSHIFGNALEALVGAVYLDVGYNRTRTFVLKMIVKAYMDMDLIEATDKNFKNKLLTWTQKRGKKVAYEVIGEKPEGAGARKVFTIALLIDGVEVARGTGYNKKEASQDASAKAIERLGIKEEAPEE